MAIRAALLAFALLDSALTSSVPPADDGICKMDDSACKLEREHALLQRPGMSVSRKQAGEQSIVEKYGHLRVNGSHIVSEETGRPVQLSGMSMFWSQWMAKFWNHETVQWLKQDWNVTLIRAAMGIEHGGYLENPEVEQKRLEAVVDAAIAEGIYVIIDWHDHNADQHLEESKAFFRAMAIKYGQSPNVLFEIFNEPVRQHWGSAIKPYGEQVLEVIREHTDNLVIMGTRSWSQEVDVAATDPLQGMNVAYTIHFYANSHRAELRARVERALAHGVAIFATEWGTCDASGDGSLDFEEAQAWLNFFEEHHISHANWAIGDKREACAALKPGASATGGWATCDLTESGAFVRATLRGESSPPPGTVGQLRCPWAPKPPGPHCSATGTDCSATACCQDENLVCYQKNDYWASCKPTCNPGIDPQDPPAHRTPWSCTLLN